MRIWRLMVAMFPAAVLLLGSGMTVAQDYPAKVIRIVTSPPGGANTS